VKAEWKRLSLVTAIILIVVIAFVAGVFFGRDSLVAKVKIMNPSWPQNAMRYVNPKTAQDRLLPKNQQVKAAIYSLKQFFAPWDPYSVNYMQSIQKNMVSALKELQSTVQYGINFHPYGPEFWKPMIDNMNLTAFPNKNELGIVVKNISTRALPTDLPAFTDPFQNVTYPFDNFSASPLWAGQPVRILNQSKDGAWYLIHANFFAWVNKDDIVLVTPSFADGYRKNTFVAITRDNVAIKDKNGEFLFYSRVGSLLPVKEGIVYAPIDHEQLTSIDIPRSAYTRYPLTMTPYAVARIMNAMMGEPYTWGLVGYRECSLTLKNLFMTFGIWLPKYSQNQLTYLPFTDLSHLSDQEKLKIIQSKAKPFLTLLGTPSHVTLYVGRYKNHDMVFQDHWGYHTTDLFSDTGRLVIGKTIIDSLIPADKDKNTTMESYLLTDLSKMTSLSQYPPRNGR
jgi:hypothetical protein